MIVKRKNQIRTKRVLADTDMDVDVDVEETGAGDVYVDPESTDLLFEAEDVAELVAEVTGEEVSVTSDEDGVTFTVAGDEFYVEPEGDEEILEASRKKIRSKRPVSASRSIKRPALSKKPMKRMPSKKR